MIDRLDTGARRAVSVASDEAHRLGHPHVGTEHLLLGLLADSGTSASAALVAAGASLVSVREKVIEALASRTTRRPVGSADELPFTERATRALDRAGRLSLRTGRDQVSSEDILHSVLDVEGTAGQVLRGLNVDPEAVRGALESAPPTAAPEATTTAPETQPRQTRRRGATGPLCGSCGAPLASSLDHTAVRTGSGTAADVFYCTVCGTALGVDPHSGA